MLVDTPAMREVAKVYGNSFEPFKAVTYVRLFHRFIEIEKTNALKLSKWKFDAPCGISSTGKNEIGWWRQGIQNSPRKMISAPTGYYIIHNDASNLGLGTHDVDQSINGG